MDTTELVGKTIARVVESNYDEWGQSTGLIVWFTDGSAVRVEPDGWEVDGITLQATDAATLEADYTANIQSSIDSAWSTHEYTLRKVDEMIKMAEAYHVGIRFGPDGLTSVEGDAGDEHRFRRWYQERYGMSAFSRAMKEEFLGPMRDAAVTLVAVDSTQQKGRAATRMEGDRG